MTDFEEYIRQSEPHKREKGYAWQTAIGLQAVDGLKTSDYLRQTARQHIEGDLCKTLPHSLSFLFLSTIGSPAVYIFDFYAVYALFHLIFSPYLRELDTIIPGVRYKL